jgi:hypothetical protein
MSNEKALMQEAWRVGYQHPDGFTIRCYNEAAAVRTRFGLYAAVKEFRNGKGEPDDILREAINNCALTIVPDGVLIQRKLASEIAKDILKQLGREPKTVEAYNAEASLGRIMEKINNPAPDEVKAPINETAARYGARQR